MARSGNRRGITLLEVAVGVGGVGLAAVLIVWCLRTVRTQIRLVEEATQIGGIHNGMALWSGSHRGYYPLPSEEDVGNATVALAQGESAAAKDTIANIVSLLIYNGYFSPETCISLREVNPNIRAFGGYQFSRPPAAVDPPNALWDPAFQADFTGGRAGSLSFAMSRPLDARLGLWRARSGGSTEAVVGNRGPEVKSVAIDSAGNVSPAFALPNSNTLRIHGGATSWEGNICYNDNHVAFMPSVAPTGDSYADATGARHPDVLFYDEPDDAKGTNNYLTIWTKAGPKATDYLEIWD